MSCKIKFLFLAIFSLILLGKFFGALGLSTFTLECSETNAVITFNDVALEELGVASDDYLIVHNQVQDDVTNLDNECKHQSVIGSGSLTFNLTQCNPKVIQDDNNIVFIWYARNAEQSPIKRRNGCRMLNCTFPRKQMVKSGAINTTREKVTLVNLSGSGAMIDLTLDIFSDAFRNEIANLFFVPDTVYARVAISTFGVPNTFYPQIIRCWATEAETGGTVKYTLIDDGISAEDTTNVSAFEPKQEDFSFSSFVWSNTNLGNDVYVKCQVFICNSDIGLDCTVAQGPLATGGRRKREIRGSKDTVQMITAGPIHNFRPMEN